MTNKEAIWIINNKLNIDHCTDEVIKALDLALKALEKIESIKFNAYAINELLKEEE